MKSTKQERSRQKAQEAFDKNLESPSHLRNLRQAHAAVKDRYIAEWRAKVKPQLSPPIKSINTVDLKGKPVDNLTNELKDVKENNLIDVG